MVSTQGFLLSYVRYGDSDAFVNVFTQENGYESYYAKGIYTSKSKKKPYLQPLNELQYTVNKGYSTNLKHLTRIEPLKVIEYPGYREGSIIFFISEFLNHVLRNEPPHSFIYQEIKLLIKEITEQNYNAHTIFMIRFIKILGLAPLTSADTFLQPESGIFSNHQFNSLFSESISSIWKNILLEDDNYKIHIPPEHRVEMLNSILYYYQHHISNFKIPKSLEIVRQFWD